MSQIAALIEGVNPYIALAVGLFIMAFAGDFLVNGAVTVARRLGVSPLIAGIFIVGFGTSAPEMVVSLDAAIRGNPGLALGNIVGSNIANVWLVLAVPALLAPYIAGGQGQRRALVAMLLTTMAWIIITATMQGGLHAGVGLFFVGALISYCIFTVISTRRDTRFAQQMGDTVEEEADDQSFPLALVIVVLGILGLVLGSNLIVSGGVRLATDFGVSQEIIGLTLLAVGTSLPEIGAGIAAVMNKRGEVLFGNILGSNIFNILGAGGIVSFFGPVAVAPTFHQYDHWAMGAAALTAAIFIVTRSKVTRLAGVALLLIYALYIYGLVNGWNILGLFTPAAT